MAEATLPAADRPDSGSVRPSALRLLLMQTKLGLAIRSTAQDREVANLMGMNESRVALYTVGISIALAGFTGAVIVPLTIVEPFMWLHPLIMMMAVVVLGGLGSIMGTFVAGIVLGVTQAATTYFFGGTYRDVVVSGGRDVDAAAAAVHRIHVAMDALTRNANDRLLLEWLLWSLPARA